MDPAPMEKEGAADPNGPTPTKPWVGVEDAPKERLLPDVPIPGVGLFCPKVGVEVPPNIGLLSDVLPTLKAKGVLWLGAAKGFWLKPPPKGVAPVVVVPLCPVPKLKAPVVELAPGLATLIPKPPLAAGAAELPNVKGAGAVLPNKELPVPLLGVWVVVPKPEVVAAPKEKTEVVLPKAGWVVAGAPKAEAAGLRAPKEYWVVLSKVGWAGVGAVGFPKVKEVPKLGAGTGLAGPCDWPSVAPKVSWGVAPGYEGSGALVAELKGMLKAGVVVLKVSVAWLVAAGVDVVRVLPKPLKLLLPAWGALGRGWPVVVVVGTAGGLPNWNTEPREGVKVGPEAWGVPKRKGWEEAVAVALLVLTELLIVKANAAFVAEAGAVLAVAVGAEMVALALAVKRGVLVVVVVVVVVVVGGVGTKEKGVIRGTDAVCPRPSKMGLNVGAEELVVVGATELDEAGVTVVALEGHEGEGSSASLFGGVSKMGLNVDVDDTPGAVEVEGLEVGVLSIPKSRLCLGAAGAAGSAAVVSGDLGGSVTGMVDEAEVSPKKVAEGLESSEVTGRGAG